MFDVQWLSTLLTWAAVLPTPAGGEFGTEKSANFGG